MSRVDDLITKLCPAGVVYAELSELADTVAGLTGKVKADFTDGNARFITYKNVFANLAVDQCAEDRVKVGPDERQNVLREGDVIFTGSSETADEVGMSSVVLTEPVEPIYLNSFCFALRFRKADLLLPGFCKHLFRGAAMRAAIQKAASGVTRINVSKARFMRIQIPVPPIELQREIVRVLDMFTALEAELEAELEARHRQYAHYRTVILGQVKADVVPLSALGTWQGGITPSKANSAYWDSGTIPWLASMDVSNTGTDRIRGRVTERAVAETSLRLVPAPSVAVVMRSNILRRTLPIGLIKVDTTVNQDMRALVPRQDVDAEYVFQALRAVSEDLRTALVRTDGSMAAVDSRGFLAWQIPLPSLPEQREVARRLRHFDALVNDMSVGLPAELKARRQQYEYYRDKLLTFEEAAA